MCIVCNCGSDVGGEFLCQFAQSQAAMKSSTAWMLKCSQVAGTAAQRRSYDAIHKKMVRLMADWNRLEQEREHYVKAPAP